MTTVLQTNTQILYLNLLILLSYLIVKLDGNMSITSEMSDTIKDQDNYEIRLIPVITNVFDRKTSFLTRKPCRVTIRRSNKILEATNLPSMLVLNPRSI